MNDSKRSYGSNILQDPKKTSPILSNNKQIFVNRTLNFAKVKLVGFDMDHTLALYRQDTFEALAFHETLKKFVAAGYPEELITLKFKPNFIIRGLLVDRDKGNVLKVDTHKYVKIAYHGHRKLTKEERYKLYNSSIFNPEEFESVDTIFSLSEVQLFTEIVHYMSINPGKIEKSYLEVYKDIRTFIDLSHKDGSIKNKVIKNPEHFIKKDKNLAPTLVRLIDSGKKLFVLTNSNYSYSSSILSFLLDNANNDFPHWKDYWKFILVGAGKPGFFLGDQPFFEVIEESNFLKECGNSLDDKKVYHGGNAQLFEQLSKYSGDDILYVGDHIYGDIIRSKGTYNWRTLLIIEELEEEIKRIDASRAKQKLIFDELLRKESIDEELQNIRSAIATNQRQLKKSRIKRDDKKMSLILEENTNLSRNLEEKKQELQELNKSIKYLIEDRQRHMHPVWGEMMKVGLERSRFANQVDSYACLYSSHVSNLRFYSPFKKFISFQETLPHEV